MSVCREKELKKLGKKASGEQNGNNSPGDEQSAVSSIGLLYFFHFLVRLHPFSITKLFAVIETPKSWLGAEMAICCHIVIYMFLNQGPWW